MRQDQKKAFDAFWAAWPRRVAKKDAMNAWARIAPELYERILAAVETQKQTPQWQKDGGLYIPYPATWLRGERWEDEVVVKNNLDAEALIEALIKYSIMPHDLTPRIAARFRRMCARMKGGCMLLNPTWPALHGLLKNGAIKEEQILKEFLATE